VIRQHFGLRMAAVRLVRPDHHASVCLDLPD